MWNGCREAVLNLLRFEKKKKKKKWNNWRREKKREGGIVRGMNRGKVKRNRNSLQVMTRVKKNNEK